MAKEAASGKKTGGKPPSPPPESPPDTSQFNFTDNESRIMKAGNGNNFEQAYNAQAAVDTEGSMLIVGGWVSNHANDKNELVPTVNSVPDEVREISEVCADAGYHNQKAIEKIEQRGVDENGKETPAGSVFGIIKQAIGFRQFSLRGLAKVIIEWDIVKLAYNFKRLHRLSAAYA
ncbi:MAG: hypothetical protein Ta2A_10690 [Treponemataceae bacterium]|nr:MAG: hypothetical protein Ta2A_10690 [Treponemataceae bacterium]